MQIIYIHHPKGFFFHIVTLCNGLGHLSAASFIALRLSAPIICVFIHYFLHVTNMLHTHSFILESAGSKWELG